MLRVDHEYWSGRPDSVRAYREVYVYVSVSTIVRLCTQYTHHLLVYKYARSYPCVCIRVYISHTHTHTHIYIYIHTHAHTYIIYIYILDIRK